MTISNKSALFLWVFCSAWLCFAAVFTVFSGNVIIGLLLLCFGGAASVYAFRKPVTTLDIDHGKIVATETFITHSKQEEYEVQDISRAYIHETTDSDNDPYYVARLAMVNGKSYDISEGHSKGTCEEVLTQLGLVES